MAELKTKPTDRQVDDFLKEVTDATKLEDSHTLIKIMGDITGARPQMWGPSIIGFGSYHYRYKSGREGDWFQVGFSPRKLSLVLYIMTGFSRYDELMKQLGKHKTGKGCLYIKRLSDVDMNILEKLISNSVDYLRTKT